MSQRYPTPPVFCKKSPQAIENKRGERRKEGKERKRVRKSVRTQDLPGRRRTRRERNGLKRCEGKGQAGGKIIRERRREHGGWRWFAVSRARREVLSRFAQLPQSGRAVKPQRLVAAAIRFHQQNMSWGLPGQLVGGTVWVQVAGIFLRKMRYVAL